MSIKNRLKRLKTHLSLVETTNPQETTTIDIPLLFQWSKLNCEPFYFDGQYSFIRKVTYPLNYQHGKHTFSILREIISEWEKNNVAHPLSTSGVSMRDLLFFDTETTGLNGGAGNYIFLIGYAKVSGESVTVTQYILPDPAQEAAMYAAFLADFSDDTKLVSFNGKAFDWPQVKTRHVFVRDKVPKLPQFAHFDLLHPSRRLWKKILPSCKLSIVEKEILQFERFNDIPSYLAPLLYFDFLKEKDPALLESVLLHNEWDVLSLISLYIEISSKLLHTNFARYHPVEYEEIARWYETLGNWELAISFYEKALKHNARSEIYVQLGKCYKKIARYDDSRAILEEGLMNGSYFPIEGLIELSKLYEHQFKDYEKALFYAEKAYLQWKNRCRLLKTANEDKNHDLNTRIQRLQKKIG